MAQEANQRQRRSAQFERLRPMLERGESAAALRLLGDRWSLLILRDAFLGVRRFEDLRRLSGAARGTLSKRLALLVEAGILYRSPCRDGRPRHEYRLTASGLDCYPVALALWRWQRRWGRAGGVPPRLWHATCASETEPRFACAHCHETLRPEALRFTLGAVPTRLADARAQRRRSAPPRVPPAGVDGTLFDVLDVVGDRWSALLLAALFLGARRYDELRGALGIASNILADRLRRLRARGIVEARAYQRRPLRHEYRLTERGWDLHPFALALQDWAGRWLVPRRAAALRIRHSSCGRPLRLQASCSRCGEALRPREVRLRGTRRWRSLRHRGLSRPRAAAPRPPRMPRVRRHGGVPR